MQRCKRPLANQRSGLVQAVALLTNWMPCHHVRNKCTPFDSRSEGFWQAQDASQLWPDSFDDLNCLRFRSALFRPSGVFGPVLSPPCHLQRGRPGAHIALQGRPSDRRFAPQRFRTIILIAHSYIFNFFLYSALLQPKSFARAGEGQPSFAIRSASALVALLGIRFLHWLQ